MPAEDALGTAWHGRAACERAAQTQGPYPLPMHCGTDKGNGTWMAYMENPAGAGMVNCP